MPKRSQSVPPTDRCMVVTRILSGARLRRYPLWLLGITVAIYALNLLQARAWIEPSGRIVGHDFLAFYMAGEMVRAQQLDQLYDPAAQTAWQERFMRPINPAWNGTCLYLNPPHYAWAMSALTPLGYGGSLLAWWGLSVVAFAGTVTIWRQWLPTSTARWAILLAICCPAWFWALAGGQNTFFTLLILTGGCALLLRQRDLAAGVVLSLLAYKFQLVAVPGLFLLWHRRWQALAGLAAGCVTTLGLTAIVMGPQVLREYIVFGSQLGELMHLDGFDVFKQHSWHGFFARGTLENSPLVASTLTATAALATLGFGVWTWRGQWRPGSRGTDLRLAAMIVVTLLTSPHLFHYDMLIAVLPAVIWARAASRAPVPAIDEPMRALLAVGFVWLAIANMVTTLVPVQLSAPLMLAWLVLLSRERATASITAAHATRPVGAVA